VKNGVRRILPLFLLLGSCKNLTGSLSPSGDATITDDTTGAVVTVPAHEGTDTEEKVIEAAGSVAGAVWGPLGAFVAAALGSAYIAIRAKKKAA
jgi:hypothetical protein